MDRSTDYLCNNNNDTDVEMYKEVVSTVVSTVYGVGEEEYCMNLGNVTVMYEHCAAYTTKFSITTTHTCSRSTFSLFLLFFFLLAIITTV